MRSVQNMKIRVKRVDNSPVKYKITIRLQDLTTRRRHYCLPVRKKINKVLFKRLLKCLIMFLLIL